MTFGQQQGGPADAASNWVERVLATEAQLAQQSGNIPGALDALAKLEIFRLQDQQG
jgi:hypothetical protein